MIELIIFITFLSFFKLPWSVVLMPLWATVAIVAGTMIFVIAVKIGQYFLERVKL